MEDNQIYEEVTEEITSSECNSSGPNNDFEFNPDCVADVKVPIGEKVAFAAGDLFGGGAQGLITAVYLVFMVLNGLSAVAAGSIIMVAKIWDAITDPMMGIISDNTKSKWGRRRPFIFIGGTLIIVSFGLLFLPLYKLDIKWLKYMIYLFAFLFYSTLSTVINVPYSALATEITTNYGERNKMNTIRMLFSFFSAAVSAGVPILLIEALQKQKLSIDVFSIIMIVGFGLFYTLPLLFTALKTNERVIPPLEKTKFSLKEFLKPLKLKPFVYLLVMYFAAFVCMDILTTNLVFLVKFALRVEEYSSFVLLVILSVTYAATVPIYAKLMKTKSKSFLYRLGIPLYIVGILCMGLFPRSWSGYVLLPVAFIIGLGMSGCQLLPWYIFPDIVDLGELKFGDRNAGGYSGLMTFIRKSTSAVAIGISSAVLTWTGFKAPETDAATGILLSDGSAQTATAIWGIRLVVTIPVIIFIIIALIASLKLKISPERSKIVTKVLQKEELTEEEKIEYEAIERELL